MLCNYKSSRRPRSPPLDTTLVPEHRPGTHARWAGLTDEGNLQTCRKIQLQHALVSSCLDFLCRQKWPLYIQKAPDHFLMVNNTYNFNICITMNKIWLHSFPKRHLGFRIRRAKLLLSMHLEREGSSKNLTSKNCIYLIVSTVTIHSLFLFLFFVKGSQSGMTVT